MEKKEDSGFIKCLNALHDSNTIADLILKLTKMFEHIGRMDNNELIAAYQALQVCRDIFNIRELEKLKILNSIEERILIQMGSLYGVCAMQYRDEEFKIATQGKVLYYINYSANKYSKYRGEKKLSWSKMFLWTRKILEHKT